VGGGLPGLRVLAFCDYLSAASCGGSERVAIEVYWRLAAQGAEITVLTTGARGDGTVEGVRVVAVPTLDLAGVVRAQVALAPGAVTAAARLARHVRPHVLHANSLHFQTSLAAALLQRRLGVPLVATAHLGPVRFLRAGLRAAATAHERTVGRFILARSARAIAVSDSVAAHLRALGVPADRIEVVANGVDHRRFFPAPAVDPGPSAEPGALSVAFVGRLIANKGPHLLVEALRTAGPHVRATFLGDGPMRRGLEQRVARLGLGARVAFEGTVAGPDVAERLRAADVLVRPSLTEGLPLAVLEAMASGTCVLASAVPGNLDLVEDDVTGLLFRPGDPAHLARQLARLAADPALRLRLAAAGHRRSLDYSWDATAAGTGRVLASVASGAAPSAPSAPAAPTAASPA
jgi:glycosyltransferase involved in cell wall biosynthesis